jgi:hypothetical protein
VALQLEADSQLSIFIKQNIITLATKKNKKHDEIAKKYCIFAPVKCGNHLKSKIMKTISRKNCERLQAPAQQLQEETVLPKGRRNGRTNLRSASREHKVFPTPPPRTDKVYLPL